MKITTIIPFLFLTGCINLTFDALEFDRYITIKELANSATSLCGTENILPILNTLKVTVDHQYNYATNRVNKPQVESATTKLKIMVDELYEKYQANNTPSLEYCKTKTSDISIGSYFIVKEIGKL